MKVYVLTDGKAYHDIAFTSSISATTELYDKGLDAIYYVEEVDLPFANRSICYIRKYYGFDYGICSIVDHWQTSKVYACSDHAKNDKIWADCYNRAIKDPNNYIIKDDKIASIDFLGNEFIYGDVMQDMFNTSIKHIRVIKN